MVTITLCTRQQKRHWCIDQFFGLCGRGRGWEDLGEWHWNMYTIMYETSRQSRFDGGYRKLGAGALGQPRGMVWGGRREEGSGWGPHVYLWQIHFDVWQNQYNIVKFKNKIKFLKKEIVPNIHWKDRCWSWNSNILTTWYKELTHLKTGKDWRQEEKGTTGDEMVGWHHRLNGHEFE